ncbi:hypothetical protein [Metamycoplasma alkalescens]|nr:hypothetical protein [Metamycoplasma alkalescens]PYF43086.1 hypothetical protein BCF88_1058 [Metamycoplasma alkalescens]
MRKLYFLDWNKLFAHGDDIFWKDEITLLNALNDSIIIKDQYLKLYDEEDNKIYDAPLSFVDSLIEILSDTNESKKLSFWTIMDNLENYDKKKYDKALCFLMHLKYKVQDYRTFFFLTLGIKLVKKLTQIMTNYIKDKYGLIAKTGYNDIFDEDIYFYHDAEVKTYQDEINDFYKNILKNVGIDFELGDLCLKMSSLTNQDEEEDNNFYLSNAIENTINDFWQIFKPSTNQLLELDNLLEKKYNV